MAPASGDQLVAALGTWEDGIIPGIHGVNSPAKDVYTKNLDFLMEHKKEAKNFPAILDQGDFQKPETYLPRLYLTNCF